MQAVILAGGLGSRLKPFTQVIPKPLLPVGESSVLEIQILGLKACGFEEIFIATNFRSDYVEAFLRAEDRYGLKIHISKEDQPLGTCGPLSLLKDRLQEPFILMNGDVLTTLCFDEALYFGRAIDSDLTLVTKEISTPFHFGKIASEGSYITSIEEKPNLRFEILAGIYVIKPALLERIPVNARYGIDDLIRDMLARGEKVARYLTTEYWLDIGQMPDYEAAQQAYGEHFAGLREGRSAAWSQRSSGEAAAPSPCPLPGGGLRAPPPSGRGEGNGAPAPGKEDTRALSTRFSARPRA